MSRLLDDARQTDPDASGSLQAAMAASYLLLNGEGDVDTAHRVLAALSKGDFEDAYRHAVAISPAGVLAPFVPHALWVLMDLVEAAIRTGRGAEAASHVQAMRDARSG